MAVTLDPAEFQKIQEAFRDVALRAERLQELVGLVEHFRALDTSFGLFNRTAKNATAADFPRLDDLWTPCRDFDLTRLVDWIKDMRYVRQQLAGEPEKGRSAEVDGWSADLEQLKEKLQKSMDDQAIKSIPPLADGFQSTVRKHQNRLKNITDREVRDLCNLTERLKQVLEA